MKPNLFLVGAPKCGTTSLYAWLRQHPAVCGPLRKEPHYYYNPYGRALSQSEYHALYDDAEASVRYAVDASVYYLSSKSAIEAILKDVDDPKFIVCLRNPVEIAPSLHWQKIHSGHESVLDFAEAWRLSDRRHSGGFDGIVNLPKQADPRHMAYKQICFLGQQLRDLLALVEDDRVFICFMEDIARNPLQTFTLLCAFLDISSEVEINFAPENRAKTVRFRWANRFVRKLGDFKRKLGIKKKIGFGAFLERVTRIEKRYAAPSEALLAEMRSAFADDIALLQQVTNRNLDKWRKSLTG